VLRASTEIIATAFLVLGALLHAVPATAVERLCDSSFENCRNEVIDRIRAEPVEINVGAWFFEDARFTNELIQRIQAGVRVRVLADPRTNEQHPLNDTLLQQMAAAGIPIRKKVSSGIEHWKLMLFAGQNFVYFGSSNFSADAFVPIAPYSNYVDETLYGTDDPVVVNSFKTRFDDAWIDTAAYDDYANAPDGGVARHYPIFPIDPALNFAPAIGSASYRSRSVAAYNREPQRIDIMMYRITDQAHVDALIAAFRRGIPIRIYTEQTMYRDPTQLWHSMSIDKLYMAGIPIRDRAHAGLNHSKVVLLYGQQTTIFGSSNMTSKSSDSQHEHNYFTTKPEIFSWFANQFERKWNNALGVPETKPFAPLPPDRPEYYGVHDGAVGVATTGNRLSWYGGPWAHTYDLYFGTAPNPPLFAASLALGPSETSSQRQSFALPALAAATTYYWRIESSTLANQRASGPVFSFTTKGGLPTYLRTPTDFDADSKADIAVFRPSSGEWFARYSSLGYGTSTYWRVQWGIAGDIPLVADFDGDRVADLTVFRPSTGQWFVRYSSLGYSASTYWTVEWGAPGDIPLIADFDGDRVPELTVFRPSTGQWWVRYSSHGYSTSTAWVVQWGQPGDIPLIADFDGDGLADLTVFRPSTGRWWVRFSSLGYSVDDRWVVEWGVPGDIPLVANFDGDRLPELTVFRPSTGEWFVRYSSLKYSISTYWIVEWGVQGDRPIATDYDGDGIADLSVFRPSTGQWYIRYSSAGYATGSSKVFQWGIANDIPVTR